jgi:hypothetical protein
MRLALLLWLDRNADGTSPTPTPNSTGTSARPHAS